VSTRDWLLSRIIRAERELDALKITARELRDERDEAQARIVTMHNALITPAESQQVTELRERIAELSIQKQVQVLVVDCGGRSLMPKETREAQILSMSSANGKTVIRVMDPFI
jgi:hypothetical protein